MIRLAKDKGVAAVASGFFVLGERPNVRLTGWRRTDLDPILPTLLQLGKSPLSGLLPSTPKNEAPSRPEYPPVLAEEDEEATLIRVGEGLWWEVEEVMEGDECEVGMRVLLVRGIAVRGCALSR